MAGNGRLPPIVSDGSRPEADFGEGCANQHSPLFNVRSRA
jgi:hypothetical protein